MGLGAGSEEGTRGAPAEPASLEEFLDPVLIGLRVQGR